MQSFLGQLFLNSSELESHLRKFSSHIWMGALAVGRFEEAFERFLLLSSPFRNVVPFDLEDLIGPLQHSEFAAAEMQFLIQPLDLSGLLLNSKFQFTYPLRTPLTQAPQFELPLSELLLNGVRLMTNQHQLLVGSG